MYDFWEIAVKPLLEATDPRIVLEIGADKGEATRCLLAFCRDRNSVLHSVDPAPGFDVETLRKDYGDDTFVFHQTLSLNVIDRIECPEAVLIDGDHNWYTVYNELKVLEKSCLRAEKPFPLVLMHDVEWPYARRDLYYDPETIPDAFRKPYLKQGLHPDSPDLLPEGGINAYLCNAIHENRYQSGVLTAVEDFLAETAEPIRFYTVSGLHGLGILTPESLLEEKPAIGDVLANLTLSEPVDKLVKTLESERIQALLAKNDVQVSLAKSEKRCRETEQSLAESREASQALRISLEAADKRTVELEAEWQAELDKARKEIVQSRQEKEAIEAVAAETNEKNLIEKNRLKQTINEIRKEITAQQGRTAALMRIFENLHIAVSDLLVSQRWRIGNRIGEAIRVAKRQPKVPMAPEYIEKLHHRFKDWRQTYEKAAARALQKCAVAQQPGARPQPLPAAHGVSENVLQLAHAESGELFHKYRSRPRQRQVSIVMPAYNSAHLIEKAVASVLNQHYDNYELIIVDDGSTDHTGELIRTAFADDRIRYFRTENRGPSRARNFGLDKAGGDYIAYLDADNEWHPQYLTIMVNLLDDHPDVNMAYCGQEIYDNGDMVDIRFQVFNRSLLMNKNYIDINSVVHRRRLYDEKGGFDNDLPRLEDWDLALRYTETDCPVCIGAPLVKYHKSDHFKNPLKDPRRKEARERYNKSIRMIQDKLQTRPLRLKALSGLPPFPEPLFSPHTGYADADLEGLRVSIVIPNYEALPCLKVCLEAIEAFTPEAHYELVIVDNASGAETRSFLKNYESTSDNCKMIYNEHNMGFTYAVNQGITAAESGNDIILMNNDAIVTEGWLPALVEAKRDNPEAGLIAPQQVLPPNTQTMQVHVPYCAPEREVDVTISAHHGNLQKYYPLDWRNGYRALNWATFFCIYITRDAIDKAGLPDHKTGRHFKSDHIYCRTVSETHLMQIIYAPKAKVYHLLQQSTKELKVKNPGGYRVIYEKNNWEDVPEAAYIKDFNTSE